MATIKIDIPGYNNFSQSLEVSDKYAYRISKIIQKELKELSQKPGEKPQIEQGNAG